ncbi:unnamed protein product [Gemmataceae bacterium]|nr:unnamed protein product [Gemmataceae bacterium]VTU02755.1 unnamed protein product [Gemmataceae bacterium]
MPTLSWCESTTAASPHPVRVERFCGKSRHRVHLLGEVRPLKVHFRLGENTVPCLETERPCPFCADPMWKPRHEHFGPALLMDPKEGQWKQIVAVFTPGGWNQLYKAPPGPHRGRLLDIWRHGQGSAGGGLLKLKEVSRIDPNYPAFDVLPHLIRCWFPFAKDLPPVDALPPVPVVAYEAPARQPEPEPVKVSAEVAKQFHEYAARFATPAVQQDGTTVAPATTTAPPDLPPPPPHVTSVPAAAAGPKQTPPLPPPPATSVPLNDVAVAPLGERGLGTGDAALGGALTRLIPGFNAEYGPKELVRGPITEQDEADALSKRSARMVCDDQRGKSAFLNGHAKAKGGAR